MTETINLLELMMVGGRLKPEKSNARPQPHYQNPEKTARFKSEGRGMERDEEVDKLLEIWADWMRRPEQLADGYPAEASGGFVTSWIQDSEEMGDRAEAARVEKIDAAYQSLQRCYQEAINKHFGLGVNVWRFKIESSYADAKIVMRVKLVMKGLL